MGRKTLYRAEFHPEEAKRLLETGMTEKELAQALGISENTLNEWKGRYVQFQEAITEGKKKPNRLVEAALIRRALGMKVRHIEYRPPSKEGDPAVPIRIIERDIPPNQRSMEFWLSNRAKNRWKRRITVDVNQGIRSHEKDPEKVSIILKNLRDAIPELRTAGANGNGHKS